MFKILTTAFLLISVLVQAQELEVLRHVVDVAAKRIAGANTLIKGTPSGVVTDSEGYFKINLPYGKVELLFALRWMQII